MKNAEAHATPAGAQPAPGTGARAVLLLVLVPPAYLVWLIGTYGLDVPYMDQWELPPLLEKLHAGTAGLADLWAQHNEHRIFFPRIVMLALSFLTGWNIRYELAANVVTAGLTFLVLASLVRRSFPVRTASVLTVICSLLVFSPVQWENWLWGWQIQIFLCVAGAVAAIAALDRWPGRWKGLVGAIIFGTISSYSFSNGMMIWIAAGSMMLVRAEWRRRHLLALSAAFLANVIPYLIHYESPSHHPSVWFAFFHPERLFVYVFAYLGAPLGSALPGRSLAAGTLSSALLCWGAISACRSDRKRFDAVVPWLALGLFSFLSAVVTGVGRVGFGAQQALMSRYTTISVLFLFSALAIAVASAPRAASGRVSAAAAACLCAILVFWYALSFQYGVRQTENRSDRIRMAIPCLLHIDKASDKCLQRVYPVPAHVRERVAILSARKLSLFRAPDGSGR